MPSKRGRFSRLPTSTERAEAYRLGKQGRNRGFQGGGSGVTAMPSPKGPRFYETRGFKALNTEWRLKLALSGFRDIETADGTEIHADTDADLANVDSELEIATRSRAQDALNDEMMWVGRPPAARMLLALVVAGMPARTAGRLLGQTRHEARVMHLETLRRIAKV